VALAAGDGAERHAVPVRCFACVPTPRVVVAALPCASTAFALVPGADRTSVLATPLAVMSPWHCVQPVAGECCALPSTCVAAVTVVAL
jgi:hypothetical protein